MKICFIIEYYYPHIGGAEVLFQNLAEGLVKEGHTCDVVTSRVPGTQKHEWVNGVHIHRVNVPRILDRHFFTFLSLFSAWRYARDCDVIQTTTYNGAPPAWLISRILRKPAVISILEIIGDKWFSIGLNPISAAIYRIFESLILSIPFDAYSCISGSTLNAAKNQGIKEENLHLIYPGIDYNMFDSKKSGEKREEIRKALGLREDTFLYMFFGRPGYVKGAEYLVRAVPLIKERIRNSIPLLILSRKPTRGYKEIQTMVRKLNLEHGKDVIIIDPIKREELPYYVAASDCVVVPSLSEGFGFTCVEACTMGVPVVASNIASLPEVIFGRHVLVEPKNPLSIVEGVEKVYRKEYKTIDRKVFLWEDNVTKHIDLYKSLI